MNLEFELAVWATTDCSYHQWVWATISANHLLPHLRTRCCSLEELDIAGVVEEGVGPYCLTRFKPKA
ncbi:hypothetical protein ACLOJK_004881 [Asimina triloba]